MILNSHDNGIEEISTMLNSSFKSALKNSTYSILNLQQVVRIVIHMFMNNQKRVEREICAVMLG